MNYHSILASAIAAACEAGEILRQEFHRPGGPRGSHGHAPADEAAEAAIRARLHQVMPEFGIVGEELGAENRQSRDPKQHLWLVDPNDGTAAYLAGYRGSAVSIALLRAGFPVLGVVFAFAAPNDRGDLIAWAEGEPLTRNGQPIGHPGWSDELTPGHTVLVSHVADKNSAANLACVAPARFRAVPSIAYRLALAAVGEAQAAVSLSNPGGWDYAAGHALLRAVGGELLDAQGIPVRYTVNGQSHCGRICCGGSPAIAAQLVKADWDSVYHRSPRDESPFELARSKPGWTVADAGRLDRAQGCLMGQLAGDSLGGLVEFSSPEEIEATYPGAPRLLHDGGHWGIMAGQPTDDSELALMLARTLITTGRFDQPAITRAYVHWYHSGPFDIGGTTATALSVAARALQHGADPADAAKDAASRTSQANGALMRISPLAIFGARRPVDELAQWARQDALLSHPHPVCQDCSAVFVVAIQHALAGHSPQEIFAHTLEWAQQAGVHPDVVETLQAAKDRKPRSYTVQMGWVRTALQNAFYQLLHSDSPESGIVDTVVQGGDTDTNAAIAGALLGATYGLAAIPAQWQDRILTCRPIAGLSPTRHPRPRAFWPVDALLLAEHLLMAGAV